MASERTATSRVAGNPKSPTRIVAGVVGAVFLLVGILGFIPGITTNLGDIEFIGHDSDAELLGLFQVNILHNLVHLAFGVIGLAAARSAFLARNFLLIGGAIYLVLWIYGLLIELDSGWNFVSLNTADNWLHFGLGAAMVLLGFAVPGSRPRTA